MEKNIDISAADLKALLDINMPINLIDVREDYEFDADNINGKLIPLGELPDRVDEIEHLKNEEIFIHCRSGARSGRAKQYLNSQGFNNVHNVLGGMLAFRELD
jgi:rhodanese-related sulfurtransferase